MFLTGFRYGMYTQLANEINICMNNHNKGHEMFLVLLALVPMNTWEGMCGMGMWNELRGFCSV